MFEKMENQEIKPKRKKLKIFLVVGILLIGSILTYSLIGYSDYTKDILINQEKQIKAEVEGQYGSVQIKDVKKPDPNIKNPLTTINPRRSFLNSSGDEVAYIDHAGNIQGVGNLTFNTSSTGGYGFFVYLGERINRITKGWFVDIDASGNINTTGLYYGNGSQLDISTADITDDNTYLQVAGDTGTGNFIFNQNLTVNGTTLFVDTQGRVGIGTTTPTHKLNVVGDSNFTENATFEKDVIIDGTIFGGSAVKISGGLNVSGNITFDTDSLFIDSSNNRVGIGTTSPAQELHVASGDIRISDTGSAATSPVEGRLIFDNQYDNSGASTANKIILFDSGAFRAGLGISSDDFDFYTGADTGNFRFWVDHDDESSEGTEVFTILNSGNVGIGTSTPTHTLNIVGDLNVTGTSYLGNIIIDADNITLNDLISKDGNISFFNSTNTEIVRFVDNGRIGIGVTSPAELLEVEDIGATTGIQISNTAADGDPILAFALSGTKTFTMGIDDGDGDKFKIGTTAIDTNTRVTIDSSGNFGIGTNSPLAKLDVLVSGTGDIVVFQTSADGGQLLAIGIDTINKYIFFDPSSSTNTYDIQFFKSDATPMMTLDQSSGFVGIGTISPSHTLNVVGDLNVTGTSYLGTFVIQNELIVGNINISGLTDRIGIGTINPAEALDLSSGNLITTGTITAGTLIANSNLQISGAIEHIGDVDTEMKFGDDQINLTAGNIPFITIIQTSQDILVLNENSFDVDFRIESNTDTHAFFLRGSDGNVGIGTAEPVERLHVMGNLRAISDSDVTTELGSGIIYTQNTEGTIGLHIDVNEIQTVGDNLHLQINSERDLDIGGGDLFVETTSGNVGIGTGSPSVKLDVRGAINATDWTNVSITEAQVSDLQLYLLNKTNVNLLDINASSATIHGNLNVTGTSYLGTFVIQNELIVGNINISGTTNRIGIGTSSPGATLDVDGDIHSNDGFFRQGTAAQEIRIGEIYGDGGLHKASGDMQFDVASGGNIKFTVDDSTKVFMEGSSGNVGIGTTGPNATLEVINGTTQGGFMVSSSSSGAGDLFIVDEAGNVGIGTSTPQTNLHTVGTSGASGGLATDGIMTISTSTSGTDALQFGVVTNDYAWIQSVDPGNVFRDLILQPSSNSVGIGTTGPTIDLAIGDNDTGFDQSADGVLDYYSNNVKVAGVSGGKFHIYQVANSAADDPACRLDSGEITRGSSGCTTSSIRYKQNIQDLNYGLKEIMQLKPFTYEYKTDSSRTRFGMIAEEVALIFPEIIGYEPDNPLLIQTYDKRDVQAVLIKAIQELKQENDMLKSELCLRDNTYSWC